MFPGVVQAVFGWKEYVFVYKSTFGVYTDVLEGTRTMRLRGGFTWLIAIAISAQLAHQARAWTCPGDFTQDQSVDVDDLLYVIQHWAPPGGAGGTDVSDLLLVIQQWGDCPMAAPTVSNTYTSDQEASTTHTINSVVVPANALIVMAYQVRNEATTPPSISAATWTPSGGSPQSLEVIPGTALFAGSNQRVGWLRLKAPVAGTGTVAVTLDGSPTIGSQMVVMVITGHNLNAPIDAVANQFDSNPGSDIGDLTITSTIADGLAIHAVGTNFVTSMTSASGWTIAANMNLNDAGGYEYNFFVHHKAVTAAGANTGQATLHSAASAWNTGIIIKSVTTQKTHADDLPDYYSPNMADWTSLLAVQPNSSLVNLAALGDSRLTGYFAGHGVRSEMAFGHYMKRRFGATYATRIMFGGEGVIGGCPSAINAFPTTNGGCGWVSGFRAGASVLADLGTSYVPGEALTDLLMKDSSNLSYAVLDHNCSYPFDFNAEYQLGVGGDVAEGNPGQSYCPLSHQWLLRVWAFTKSGSGELNVKAVAKDDIRFNSANVAELNGAGGQVSGMGLDDPASPPEVRSEDFGPFTVFTQNPNERYLYAEFTGTNATGARFLACQWRSASAKGIVRTQLGFPAQTSAWHTEFANCFPALEMFDAVQIQFGAHDMNSGAKTATQYKQAIQDLVAAIRGAVPLMPIILVAEWRAYDLTDILKLENHAEYAGALKELCDQLSSHGPMLLQNTLGIINRELNFEEDHATYFPVGDFIHLNLDGAQAVEEAVWDAFYRSQSGRRRRRRGRDRLLAMRRRDLIGLTPSNACGLGG